MKLIVGLGNPGKKYSETRHNIGFQVIDHLAHKLSVELDKEKFDAVYGIQTVGNQRVMLCKPLTFMNLSGDAIRPLLEYYNVDIDNMLVIYDDLDLVPGKLRLRQKGSAGGHNGMRSIIQQIGTDKFKRLRFGIGRPPHPKMKVVDYVLARFQQDELATIQDAVENATLACEKWLSTPFLEVMNDFNR